MDESVEQGPMITAERAGEGVRHSRTTARHREQARCYFVVMASSIVLTVLKGRAAAMTASPVVPAGERRPRDPEDRAVEPSDREAVREKMFDKTVADSFPASDPPSSIPDPEEDPF